MKKKFLILAVTGLMAGTVFTACNNSAEKVENAAENVADAREDLNEAETKFAEEWEKFRLENEQQIQYNENEIANYRAMEKADQSWSNKYRTRIDELETRNTALRTKMNQYEKEKRQDNWESFKAEFKHDMDELGAGLKSFGQDNKK
ncbi:MAG: hypothetical protein K0S33_661 [Bacteroidetes bacterium]|jgi:phosphoenolpyruvate-protein kinase (PTS system EI component)|nr:hypothetical protein [Bacteroidota bacterium]